MVLQADVNILPRDSLAEIMAAEEVIAAKNKLTSVASLSNRHSAVSFESSRSLTNGEAPSALAKCKSFYVDCKCLHACPWTVVTLKAQFSSVPCMTNLLMGMLCCLQECGTRCGELLTAPEHHSFAHGHKPQV